MYRTHLSAFQEHDLYTTVKQGSTVVTTVVQPELSSIYTLNEFKDQSGVPTTVKTDVDYLFNYIINDIADNPLNDGLIIGRCVVLESIFTADQNFNIVNDIFANINDLIDYDTLAATDISSTDDVLTLISSIMFNAVTEKIQNLCITRQLLSNMSTYIDKVANKIFRNLNQLIRVKRDWRLYGPGATISGNYLSDTTTLSACTSIPSECFVRFKDGYVAGDKPYNVDTPLSSIVAYSYDVISPATSFTPAEHTHTITFDIDTSKTRVTCNEGPWSPSLMSAAKANDEYYNSKLVNWDRVKGLDGWEQYPEVNKNRRAIAIADGTNKQALFSCTPTFSYGANKKYLSQVGSSLNTNHLELPTYFTYMWQWKSDDPTQLF